MRFIGTVCLIVLAVLLLATTVARQVGHTRPATAFPVPLADGRWQDMRLFALDETDVIATLNTQTGVVASSANMVSNAAYGGETGYSMIEFDYLLAGGHSTPVLLYWSNHRYTLARDWRVSGSRPLLFAGDVVGGLGDPVWVSLVTDQAVLHYPSRGMQVTLRLTAYGPGWARLSPADSVTSLTVQNPDMEGGLRATHYSSLEDWRGFGIYRAVR